jgi:hypothetical protein
MPRSTAASVTKASLPAGRLARVSVTSISLRGRISAGASMTTSRSRSAGSTPAQASPTARAGIRFAAISIGR